METLTIRTTIVGKGERRVFECFRALLSRPEYLSDPNSVYATLYERRRSLSVYVLGGKTESSHANQTRLYSKSIELDIWHYKSNKASECEDERVPRSVFEATISYRRTSDDMVNDSLSVLEVLYALGVREVELNYNLMLGCMDEWIKPDPTTYRLPVLPDGGYRSDRKIVARFAKLLSSEGPLHKAENKEARTNLGYFKNRVKDFLEEWSIYFERGNGLGYLGLNKVLRVYPKRRYQEPDHLRPLSPLSPRKTVAKYIKYARENLAIFIRSDEFREHFAESKDLIDPSYESSSVPDLKEDLNGAFRCLTANLGRQQKNLIEDMVIAAFVLGQRAGMSASLDGRGSVYIDEDPTRTQWCRGDYRDCVLRSWGLKTSGEKKTTS